MQDEVQCFDRGWAFHRGDIAGAHEPGFDDSAWRVLDLPHDWSAESEFSTEYASATGFLPGGRGWYRKRFTVDEGLKNRLISLVFDAVQRDSDVWINGVHLGHRPNGYVGFSYDITNHVRFGPAGNVVAVRAERDNVADSRWYPGTGIYRHVWLCHRPFVHVVEDGIFVTTPRVTADRADIACVTEVRNAGVAEATLRVVSRVLSPAGKRLSETASTAVVQAGTVHAFADWQKIDRPEHWDISNPALYTMETEIHGDSGIIHRQQTAFGVRQFHFDPNRGFFLNGSSLKIKGVCLHHDAGALGAAVPEGVWARRLMLIKAMGANAVRCAHNPQAPEFYELCDRLGLLVMDEAFDEWELGKRKWVKGRNTGTAERFGYSAAFSEWAARDLGDMVRQHRKHPSIVMWSIGNEIDYPTDPYVHAESRVDPDFADFSIEGMPAAARLSVVAPFLIAAVKNQDPTRPVTMALANLPAANGTGLADMLDVAGYNYQEQHYAEDHLTAPGRVVYGSENGKALEAWLAVKNNDYISAQFIWSGFDFLGEAGSWPDHGSQAGLFDTAGFAKAHALQFEAWWKAEPVVHLVSKVLREREGGHYGQADDIWRAETHWSWPKGTTVRVSVLSNCDRVELSLNGRSLGSKEPGESGRAVWDLPFESGTLSARGIRNGKEAASITATTANAAAKLRIRRDHYDDAANAAVAGLRAGLQPGRLAQLIVEAVDGEGRVDPNFSGRVALEITGGKILALDNGNQADPTALASHDKPLWKGRLFAIVALPDPAGTVSLRATAPGLAEAKLDL